MVNVHALKFYDEGKLLPSPRAGECLACMDRCMASSPGLRGTLPLPQFQLPVTAFRPGPRRRSVAPIYFIKYVTAAFRVPTKARTPAVPQTLPVTCDALSSLNGIDALGSKQGRRKVFTTAFKAGVAARQSEGPLYDDSAGIKVLLDRAGLPSRFRLLPLHPPVPRPAVCAPP